MCLPGIYGEAISDVKSSTEGRRADRRIDRGLPSVASSIRRFRYASINRTFGLNFTDF